jgi:hypothetical protein
MFENFLRRRVEKFDDSVTYRCQQDEATAHTARRSLGILREMFTSRFFSLLGDTGRPARSPDLNPCDFFYGDTSRPRFINIALKPSKHLRTLFIKKLAPFPQGRLKVMENFRERLRQCIANNGGV